MSVLEVTLLELERRILDTSLPMDDRATILDDEFAEFGSSGRVYDKASILEYLRTAPPREHEFTSFRVVLLAPGVALATYQIASRLPEESADTARRSLRATIFIERGGRWLMRFHQGTLSP